MATRLGALSLLLLVALGGCGGGQTTTALSACTIIMGQGQTGECVQYPGPLHLTAVSRNSTLRLPTLSARVLGTRTARSFHASGVRTVTARGLYLVVSLKVTNLTDSPRSFNTSVGSTRQTQLIDGHRTYNDAFKAENTVDPRSFLTQASRLIAAQKSRIGDVIFDLAPSQARAIAAGDAKEAGLVIANFGTTIPTAAPPDSLNPTDTGGLIALSR